MSSVHPPPKLPRNVWLLGLDMAIFAMGQGALGHLTLIPLFVSKVTDNPLAVGAVTAAIQIGWLPQIFMAGTIERSARKWPWVTWFSTVERLPALVLVFAGVLFVFYEAGEGFLEAVALEAEQVVVVLLVEVEDLLDLVVG